MPLASKFLQIIFLFQRKIRLPCDTSPRDFNVDVDIFDEALLTYIIIFRSYETTYKQVHSSPIEVVAEFMQDMDLL